MFEISRRDLILSSAATAAVLGLKGHMAFIGVADAQTRGDQGFHRFSVGSIEVTAVYDGIWENVRLPDGRGRNVIGCGDALVGALAYEYCNTRELLAAARLGMAAAHYNLGTFGVPEIDAEGTRQLVESVKVAPVGSL